MNNFQTICFHSCGYSKSYSLSKLSSHWMDIANQTNNFMNQTFNQIQVMPFHFRLELLPLWSFFFITLHFISFHFKYFISNSNNCNLYNSSINFQAWNTLDDACLIPVNQFSKIYLFPNFNKNSNFPLIYFKNSCRQIKTNARVIAVHLK